METDVILVDEPLPLVRRITMNRPDKRNSLIHTLRGAILDTLRAHDQDPDVAVTIIRGAGPSFSAGYDLGGGNEGLDMPYYTPGGEGAWPRHVTEGWMSIWDLAKPVIAQVHGYCLAGTELCALGTHTKAMRNFVGAAREKGLTNALQERDAPFGDYRTS
jgi:enoyl-CoA hydratase